VKGQKYQATRNVLLSHVRAVQAFRANSALIKESAKIGITLNMRMYIPTDPKNAAEQIECNETLESAIGIWADPILFGNYPESLYRRTQNDPEKPIEFTDNEKALFKAYPIDVLGINYYSTTAIKQNPEKPSEFEHVSIGIKTGADWLWSYPDGILLILRWVNNRYCSLNPGLTLAITENGCATNTTVEGWSQQVELHDEIRVQYYKDHVEKLTDARKEGIPVCEYYAWTITDNFEWGAGYTERFGLIYVDFDDPNRKREKKDSYKWWKNFTANK